MVTTHLVSLGLDHYDSDVNGRPGKYLSVRNAVMELIAELGVGDALPPERTLSARFGVSRMTLRRALDELVREGLLCRQQGRGTFVAEPAIARPLTMTPFCEDMRRRGLDPSSRTLSVEWTHAGARMGRRLEVSPDDRVVQVVRLRLADGAPIAIETAYIPAELVPGLTAEDLADGALDALLANRYGLRIGTGLQLVEPTVTSAEESEALQVPLHSPAFLFERTTRSGSGGVIDFRRSVYRGDRYQLIVELEPPPAARGR